MDSHQEKKGVSVQILTNFTFFQAAYPDSGQGHSTVDTDSRHGWRGVPTFGGHHAGRRVLVRLLL